MNSSTFQRGAVPPPPRLAEIEAALRRAIKARPNAAEAHFRLGMVQQHKGELAAAERSYRMALRLAPGNADALNNLGLVLEARGRPGEAEALWREALARQAAPGLIAGNLGRLLLGQDRLDEAAALFEGAVALPEVAAAAHYGLATARQRQGRLDEAEAQYRAAVLRAPAFADALNDLGILLRRTKRDGEAEDLFRRAIRSNPGFAAGHLNLGVLLFDQERLDEAEACFERAHALAPDWADAHYYLGVMHRERYRYPAAEAAFRHAVALAPGHAGALTQLGVAMEDAKQFGEAEQLYRRSVAADPSYIEARLTLGALLSRLRRDDEALAIVEEVLALAPRSADAVNTRGTFWELAGNFEEALGCYERALALDPRHPDAQFNRGRLYLHLERWTEGWEGYEWRLRNKRRKIRFFRPILWDGGALEGKTIMLHAEQGMGDSIQFCRYVPLIAERAGRVLLTVQPPLHRLLAQLPGVAGCHDMGKEPPPYDCLLPLASLPRVHHTTASTIPATAGYLEPAGDALERWRTRLDAPSGRLRIGLAWAGNPEQSNDRNRSASLRAFLPLLEVPGTQFYSLQVGPRAAEVAEHDLGDRLIDLSPELTDFAETAAVMSVLDLVITVDTSVAHLAGALGRPAWVALTFLPDWRWHRAGTRNPWYASLRLFRQTTRGDWASVVAEIAGALREHVRP